MRTTLSTALTMSVIATLLAACGSKSKTDSTQPTAGAQPSEPAAVAPAPANNPPTGGSNPALAVAKQWNQYSTAKQWDKLATLYAEDAVVIAAGSPMSAKGRAAIMKFFKSFHDAFPDITSAVTHTFAGGDKVASIAMIKGTHSKPMMGMPATNKPMSFVGFDVIEVANGKIVKQTLYADNYNFMRQLGVFRTGAFRPVWQGTAPAPVSAMATSSATERTNLAVVAELAKQVNARAAAQLAALYTADAWLDDQSGPARISGNGEISKAYQELFAGFPDLQLAGLQTWAAGDYVIATYTMTGTNTGNFGRAKANNTGKKINIPSASVFRFHGDKVSEHWVFMDGMVMGMQLGVLKFGM